MNVEAVQNIIKKEKIDLLLLEACVRPALLLSHVIPAPVIQISSLGPMKFNVDTIGSIWHPLLYPDAINQRLYNLSNWEKIMEVWKFYKLQSVQDEVEAAENVMAKRMFGPNAPTMNELKKNVDMLFLNTYPTWENNRPVPPSVVYMGGLHQKPEKDLPTELKSYLDSSKNGVIYISFGTNVQPSLLPRDRVEVMSKVFSELPYDVLWKWDTDDLPGRSKNIRISKWLPQSDLLRHPKIKVFITQCGLQSTDEAITAGVPLIGVPMLGDQWYNAEKYVHHKIGVKLNLPTMTGADFRNAIDTVISDESYRHNIKKLGSTMRDQPESALERAVWWTEHVLRHGGARHLRSPAANMSWAEYLELELVLTFHQVVFRVLTQELARRGHEVTVITTDPAFPNGGTPANLTEIDVHDLSYENWKIFREVGSTGEKDLIFQIRLASEIMLKIIEMQLKVDKVKKILKEEKFDLVLLEACARPAIMLSHVFKAPVIQISSLGPCTFNVETVGSAWHPLLYPTLLSKRLHNLTKWEKLVELWNFYKTESALNEYRDAENELAKRLFGPSVPPINELNNNVAMLFLNIHPIWEGNRPVPPSVIYMGGLHQLPVKKLPTELQTYLDSSKYGIIYISFGTNVQTSMLPLERVRLMVQVLSELPYDVLWKWDQDELPERSKNIRISKWLPQSDLLRHPKIKLFITQGGLQSTDEAITARVPLIGIPMLGDQWYNVEKYEHFGIGVKLDLLSMSEEEFKKAITTVIGDKSYHHNIVKLGNMMRDQPQTPLERAVWWTEHVLRHGGAKHLRASSANMTWAQYLELQLVRGHEVTVITPDPAFPKGETPENLTEIDVHDFSYETWNTLYDFITEDSDLIFQMRLAYETIVKIVEMQLNVDQVKKVIKEEKFDLLLLEACARPALLLSHIVKEPVILVSSFGPMSFNTQTMGSAWHPLLYPDTLSQRLYNLTNWEKVVELWNFHKLENVMDKVEDAENELAKRMFGKNAPTISELKNNVDMLFLNVNPIWEGNRPVPPSVIYMGGLHQKPVKELPMDLKTYLDSSKHGVIYLSFGTNVLPSLLPVEKVEMIAKVFSQLPYDVLWKWNDDELPGRSENIRISKWLPQSDLLRHPKIKLFVTQGGLQSTDEAITAGVPLVGIPVLGDQWYNTEKYEYHKIGRKLDLLTMTEEEFKNAVTSVIGDESYRQNILKLGSMMRDQPQPPLERAVWWTEHVLRHGGARHLRAPAANMSWAEYLELELVLILFAIVLGDNNLNLQMKKIYQIMNEVTEMQMKLDKVQKIIKENKFDLLMLEACARPALLMSHVVKAPVIHVSSFGPMNDNVGTMGSAWHPILYPDILSKRLYNVTQWEKIEELWNMYTMENIMHEVEQEENEMGKRLFGPNTPTIKELKNKVEMLFLNIHPIWEGNRPVPPSVIYMGGLPEKPVKELPSDLKTYLDSSKNGVIYISFGTNVQPSLLPPDRVELMAKVFSKLPYDVLWKWDKDVLPGRSKNIRISKWLPQSDLLRHPKIKVFITQGGLQSTDEAITAGIPLIGIPMLGDQWYNVEKYLYHKIGVKLDLLTMTAEDFKAAINNVIEDKSFRQNIVKLNSMMRDQPQSPLDRGVWWIEYVLRHGGARHLRAPAANMSWAEYLELELLLVLTAVLLAFVLVVSLIVFGIYVCGEK
ncbi:hypothetical protein PYW07_010551 [Mythimna separata]|uniref:UDP-glucuronosyltransferase n=1 Tax=Mythimna separata TaxID=271217 RepID=A0AAD7YA50_MYTSE|nr:hypothetical protein PYW07_010551 [Mythimna separata]